MRPSGSVQGAALVPVLAIAFAGCGGNAQGTLSGRDVVAAFAKAGVPLTGIGTIDGDSEYVLGHGSGIYDHINDLDVQVFPTMKDAESIQASGGNIEASANHPIAPFAVVKNVVVTISPAVRGALRRKSARAVASLRRGH